jgi:hypothetical protein
MNFLSWSILFLLFAIQHTHSLGAELSKKEICQGVHKRKNNVVLLNGESRTFANEFYLGEFYFVDKDKTPEFIPSSEKYTMIMASKRFVLEEDCSLSVCIDRAEVKPLCPNSREYQLSFRVNPAKFPPGKFSSDVFLRLYDENDGFDASSALNLSFLSKISGSFNMPRAEIVQQPETSTAISGLLNGNIGRTTLELTNSGNRPLKLGKWDGVDRVDGALALDSSECENRVLNAGDSCKMDVRNSSGKRATTNYVFWENHHYKEATNITLYFTRRLGGELDYNIKNN